MRPRKELGPIHHSGLRSSQASSSKPGSHSRFSLRAVSPDRSFLTSERCAEDRPFPRLTSQNAFLADFRVPDNPDIIDSDSYRIEWCDQQEMYSVAMISRWRLYALCPSLLCLLWLTQALAAQTPVQAARKYTETKKPELVQQFSEFLAIPNVAADPADLRRNADLL